MLGVEVISHVEGELPLEMIGRAVRQLLRQHRVLRAEINVAIVDDQTIQRLNRQFLKHDYPTDVLSFPLESPAENGLLAGDVIVSWETARARAVELSLRPEGELLLYVIHGTLHLLGLDDTSPGPADRMRAAERQALEEWGFPEHCRCDDAHP